MNLRQSSRLQYARWYAGELLHRRLGPAWSSIIRSHNQLERRPDQADRPVTDDPLSTDSSAYRSNLISDGDREMVPSYRHQQLQSAPLSLRPADDVNNPVLTIRDVTDREGWGCIADPFMFIPESGPWYMFFEVYNRSLTPSAVIGHATSTDRGKTWEYGGVVLQSDIHLAFPYVFKWRDTYYMLPERHSVDQTLDIKLYATDQLPGGWTPVATVVSTSIHLHDSVVFRKRGRWWLIAGTGHDLYAYHSTELTADDWHPHDANPIVSDRLWAGRPGGRPIITDDSVLLFLQAGTVEYGQMLRVFEVDTLSQSQYADTERPESPILIPTDQSIGWNSGKMHHIDPWYVDGEWRCAVDGNIGLGRRLFGRDHWTIGIYNSD